MNDTLDTLARKAAEEPLAARESLYRKLLGSPTYLLNVGEPGGSPGGRLAARNGDVFSVWADQEPESGGVWVPLFTSPERVSDFVARRCLEPPAGKEFYWMSHEGGEVYSLLLGVECFSGLRLNPSDGGGAAVAWSEVNALSEGRLPAERPSLYKLPAGQFRIPSSTKVAVGPMDKAVTGMDGEQVLFSDAGDIRAEDYRRLVSIGVGPGPGACAWTPCRHFVGAVRNWMGREPGRSGEYADFLVRCLMGFEMYGEAEAFCLWLQSQGGNEAFAWIFLSAVYGRTGRLASCAELCEKGIWKYSGERAFYLNQARAYAQLDDRAAAQESARRGLAVFPNDAALMRFL